MIKNTINILVFILVTLISVFKAQSIQAFTSAGTQDQYVPVVFSFSSKPFSISRETIHQNRRWLAYGIATINGIGFAWGSGNTMIKLENFTHGVQHADATGNWYSYIGKVMGEWIRSGIIVYLRGGTTYYTDGNVVRNDGMYTATAGPQQNLASVPITEPGFNIQRGVYIANWEINANTRSIDSAVTNTENIFSSNGNIGIGAPSPKNRLDVNGTVHAKEVKVDMEGWADFVFQEDYQLPTLEEVERHINEKGYLPHIPSTKEVTENGLSLGKNQKLLLQKIEELTLYIIEQNKLNKEQSLLLQQQRQEIQDLRNEVRKIRKK